MKYIYLLVMTTVLLLQGGCTLINDVPRHTADELITIAKSFSSECRVQIGTSEPCG